MRGLEKFQPSILVEGNPPAGQLDLQMVRPVAHAKQYGLPVQRNALLPVLQNFPNDVIRLLVLPLARKKEWFLLPPSRRPKVLRKSLARQADDPVAGIQDGLTG